MCHKQPAIGGTSPSVNPQVALAKLHNASNTVPVVRYCQRSDPGSTVCEES